jgi:hypothetical protein
LAGWLSHELGDHGWIKIFFENNIRNYSQYELIVDIYIWFAGATASVLR